MTESQPRGWLFVFEHKPRRKRGFFYFREIDMEWIGWAVVAAQIAMLAAYRYWFGRWPLKFDL